MEGGRDALPTLRAPAAATRLESRPGRARGDDTDGAARRRRAGAVRVAARPSESRPSESPRDRPSRRATVRVAAAAGGLNFTVALTPSHHDDHDAGELDSVTVTGPPAAASSDAQPGRGRGGASTVILSQ